MTDFNLKIDLLYMDKYEEGVEKTCFLILAVFVFCRNINQLFA